MIKNGILNKENAASPKERRAYAQKSLLLEAALNLAGTKAASANIHLAHSAVNHRVNGLNVGSPSGPGLSVGMAYQITAHNALLAYFAVLTHALHLLTTVACVFTQTDSILARCSSFCKQKIIYFMHLHK